MSAFPIWNSEFLFIPQEAFLDLLVCVTFLFSFSFHGANIPFLCWTYRRNKFNICVIIHLCDYLIVSPLDSKFH